MPFCTTCGLQAADNAKFCPSCGRTAAGGTTPGPTLAPLDYKIQGDNLQVARIFLKPGQDIYAEAGRWYTRRNPSIGKPG